MVQRLVRPRVVPASHERPGHREPNRPATEPRSPAPFHAGARPARRVVPVQRRVLLALPPQRTTRMQSGYWHVARRLPLRDVHALEDLREGEVTFLVNAAASLREASAGLFKSVVMCLAFLSRGDRATVLKCDQSEITSPFTPDLNVFWRWVGVR